MKMLMVVYSSPAPQRVEVGGSERLHVALLPVESFF